MPRMRAISASVLLSDNDVLNGPLMLIAGSHKTFVACAGEIPRNNYENSLKMQKIGVRFCLVNPGRISSCGHFQPYQHHLTVREMLSSLGEVHLRERRAQLGMIFQRINLFSHLTVLCYIAEVPVKVRGLRQPKAKARAEDLLKLVALTCQAAKYPHQMSGGQQERRLHRPCAGNAAQYLQSDDPNSALDRGLVGEGVGRDRQSGQRL